MTDTVIPNGGTTDDQTPEIRIVTNAPLWGGAAIHILRNGVDIGVATEISPTEFSFTDNVADGNYTYTAELRFNNAHEDSQEYAINVVTPGTPVLLPIPTIVVYETVPVATWFNTSCPVNSNFGDYLLNVGIDSTTPSGEYAIYDSNNLRVDLPNNGSDSILHTAGTSTWASYDSNSLGSPANVGEQLRLVLIDPDFVPTPPPTETFFTDTVSSSPNTDAVVPSPLVAVLSVPITGPNIHWGIGATTILVEVTNVGSQAYVVGCGATGVSSGQDYQSIAPGQSHAFNLVCYGNPGDMVGAWININSIVVGNANFYMETQQVAATQPYVEEIPGTVVAQTTVVQCGVPF